MTSATVQSGGDERRFLRDDRSIAPPWSAVLALTGAMWTAQFAMRFSHALFDLGTGARLTAESVAGALAALAGAGLCLAMTPILKRLRPGGLATALGMLMVLTSLLAAIWRLADAAILRIVLELVPAASAGTAARFREAGSASWWLFFGWTGMWLAAAHAEQLRLASERLLELAEVVAVRDDDAVWSGDARHAIRTRVSEIVMLEAERDYVRIHLGDGRTHLVRATLTGLIDRLGVDRFVRVHRSAAVNRDALTDSRTRGGDLILTLSTGHDVRVGRRRRASVLEALGVRTGRSPD